MKFMKIVPSLATMFAVLTYVAVEVETSGKYSKDANEGITDDFMQKEKPFRMNKVNLLWIKAKQRLGSEKLKSLGKELLVQDVEEIKLKRMKAEGQDKEGMKEAELRKSFHKIMERYNLLKHADTFSGKQPKEYNEPLENDVVKAMFKDKKLNKLWKKVEKAAGFSADELITLKQEFQHHQEKVEEYHSLLNKYHVTGEQNENTEETFDNSIEQYLNSVPKSKKASEERMQSLQEKHAKLKDEYEKLQQKASARSSVDEFRDRKVKILWKLATEADFSPKELQSLKEELMHYEQRANKLNHLETELTNLKERSDNAKQEAKNHISKKIKQLTHKVNKLHEDLETRIKKRHSEL